MTQVRVWAGVGCVLMWMVGPGCGGTASGPNGGDDAGSVDAGCIPAASETRLTAACGSETRTCGGDRTWGPWMQIAPDQAEPECLQGEAQFADRVGCDGSAVRYFRCGSDCTWETQPTECGGGCDGTRRESPPLEEEICVPGGAVEIGCEDEEASCYPRHTVYLTPYYIDRYPVVVGRYQECVDAGACTPLTSFDYGDPIVDVVAGYPGAQIRSATHEQAVAFCEWDGAELVTGAQWERAAIGVTPVRVYFPWDWRQAEPTGEYCGYIALHARHCGCGACGRSWFPTADITTHTDAQSSIGVASMWNYYEWTSDVVAPYPADGGLVVNPRYPQREPALRYEHRGWDLYSTIFDDDIDIALREQTRDAADTAKERGSFRCSRAAFGSRTGDQP